MKDHENTHPSSTWLHDFRIHNHTEVFRSIYKYPEVTISIQKYPGIHRITEAYLEVKKIKKNHERS